MNKLLVKIIISICIVLVSVFFVFMSFVVGMSSHKIDASTRDYVDNNALVAVLLSFIILFVIWTPWRRFKR